MHVAAHRSPVRRPAPLTLAMAAITITIAVAAVVVLLYADPGCYQNNLGRWC